VARVRIAARSNLRSPYWTEDQVRHHHERLLNAHLPRYGLRHEISWADDVASIIAICEGDRSAGDDPMLAVANTALQLVQQVGFGIVAATITETFRTWAVTAAGGAATGLRLTKGARGELQLLGFVAGGMIGGVVGHFVKVELPIYRLAADPYGQWMWAAVPPGTAAPMGLSLPS